MIMLFLHTGTDLDGVESVLLRESRIAVEATVHAY